MVRFLLMIDDCLHCHWLKRDRKKNPINVPSVCVLHCEHLKRGYMETAIYTIAMQLRYRLY
ncbi:hypothetical protein T10_2754 [Trichinella papuae]|uniref:Uncharacterized protein n=1 Tax=Trichinella papuae TaxID=268474 RepID=A0A0V1MGC9_9BILA|nr:hypothetical protein T10_2754 [Trichinella papuae]